MKLNECVPGDRLAQMHQCRRDLEGNLPTAKITVQGDVIVLRVPFHEAVDLARTLDRSVS